MSLYVEFVGGPDHGQILPIPDDEPETILMPLIDTETRMAVYRRKSEYSLTKDGESKYIVRYEFDGLK